MSDEMEIHSPAYNTLIRRLIGMVALAVAYAVAGRLGLLLAIPPGYATAVWPPSGIALAGILLGGYGLWPGVMLGSFLVNVSTSWDSSTLAAIAKSLALASSIGAGAALQSVVGAFLIRRFVGEINIFKQEVGVIRMLILGGPVSCMVNATIGVTSLWAAGVIPTSVYLFSWWTWWVGDSIGVFIFTPLVLIWSLRPLQLWLRKQVFVTVPLVVMFAVVVGLFFFTSSQETARVRIEFDHHADTYARQLETKLDDYLDILNSMASFYASSNEVTRDGFKSFTSRLLERLPGVAALSFNQHVSDEEREAYVNSVRREGFKDFDIYQRGASGQQERAAKRSEYVVIRYIEPNEANSKAVGFDVDADPIRHAALEHARDSGKPTATGRIRLVQDPKGKPGVVVFIPIYRRALPRNTVQERRRGLQGYGVAAFRLDDIMDKVFAGIENSGLQLTLYDDTDSAAPQLLYSSNENNGSQLKPGRLQKSVAVDWAERRWLLQFDLPPEYLVAHRSWGAWSLLAAGLLFTSLLGMLLLVLVGRQAKVEELVLNQTAELKSAAELARSVTDTAYDAFITMDAEGLVIDWNRQAEIAFGWPREEVMGQTLADLIIPQQHRQAHTKGLKHYLKTGEGPVLNKRIEITALHRSGREFPVELTIWPMRMGGTYRFNAFLHDISDRHQTARRLAAQKAAAAALVEFPTLAEAGPAVLKAICGALSWDVGALWIPDPVANVLRCTEIWHRQGLQIPHFENISRQTNIAPGLGLPGRVWTSGKPAWVIDVTQDANFPRAKYAEQDGLHGAFGFPIFSDNEVLGVFEFLSHTIQKPDEDLLRMMDTVGSLLGQFMGRKHAEAELAVRAQELARSNVELEQFAYIASHDLQAPLRGVVGFSQLLQQDAQSKLGANAHEYIKFIVQGATQMQHLIKDLLAFSRVGRQDSILVPTDSEDVLTQVKSQLHAIIQERGALITHDSLPVITGTPLEINQLFQNLIGNAIKFQPGDKPRVHLSAQREGTHWKFSVRDHGIGIKPDHRERIFQIFQRLHAADEYEGTGIGLAICQKIVNRHSGRIWVESEPGKGSTFHFTLKA